MKQHGIKTAIVSVTNDLVSDNRVHRTCTTLSEAGYRVTLIGRKLSHSSPVSRSYKTHRFTLIFHKKMWFYAEYNFRLFFYILFHHCDLLVSNDLDTLLANYRASKIKHCSLLYDSHEYFTEVPELINRPKVKRFWENLEKRIIPRLPYAITVNESLAKIYSEKYKIPFYSIRNVPYQKAVKEKMDVQSLFAFPVKHVLIYQGALNIGRGIEKLIRSLKYLDMDVVLMVVGKGDIENDLKTIAHKERLSDRVMFFGKIPLEELNAYTAAADIGFSLEEHLGNNYFYALPNKLFDYIQAGVPVICSAFPEMEKVVQQYKIGKAIAPCNEKELASIINEVFENVTLLEEWKTNCIHASQELCWEKEKEKLLKLL
jgi:glycosyltransferase involved in cell wall biosynthesis